jgi:hypothetical protein
LIHRLMPARRFFGASKLAARTGVEPVFPKKDQAIDYAQNWAIR